MGRQDEPGKGEPERRREGEGGERNATNMRFPDSSSWRVLTPFDDFLAFVIEVRSFGVEEGDGPAEAVLRGSEEEKEKVSSAKRVETL